MESAVELRPGLEADLFLDQFGEAEVDEDQFLRASAEHDVFWLNVQVDDPQGMQQPQLIL